MTNQKDIQETFRQGSGKVAGSDLTGIPEKQSWRVPRKAVGSNGSEEVTNLPKRTSSEL